MIADHLVKETRNLFRRFGLLLVFLGAVLIGWGLGRYSTHQVTEAYVTIYTAESSAAPHHEVTLVPYHDSYVAKAMEMACSDKDTMDACAGLMNMKWPPCWRWVEQNATICVELK